MAIIYLSLYYIVIATFFCLQKRNDLISPDSDTRMIFQRFKEYSYHEHAIDNFYMSLSVCSLFCFNNLNSLCCRIHYTCNYLVWCMRWFYFELILLLKQNNRKWACKIKIYQSNGIFYALTKKNCNCRIDCTITDLCCQLYIPTYC